MRVRNVLVVLMLVCNSNGIPVAANTDDVISAKGKIAAQVGNSYLYIGEQRYRDALNAATILADAVRDFIAAPSEERHALAKKAWLYAHKVYSLTEVFRFGNPNVDAWEGLVNAWPVDEGFIDYVTDSYQFDEGNPHAQENIIAQSYSIDDEFLQAARGGDNAIEYGAAYTFSVSEANVATGFHAIEFLLWGQDQNHTPVSSGERPYTDYVVGEGCTHKHCQRRGEYLLASTRLLVRDLQDMVRDWQLQNNTNNYAHSFKALPVTDQLQRMLIGMGTLSYGELAGERMRVALLANDQEDEQSCFSDTTHWAIYQNALAIQTLYLGVSATAPKKGEAVISLSQLVSAADAELDATLRAQLEQTMEAARILVETAENGEPFDQMILTESKSGHALIENLITRLREQTITIEKLQGITEKLAQI